MGACVILCNGILCDGVIGVFRMVVLVMVSVGSNGIDIAGSWFALLMDLDVCLCVDGLVVVEGSGDRGIGMSVCLWDDAAIMCILVIVVLSFGIVLIGGTNVVSLCGVWGVMDVVIAFVCGASLIEAYGGKCGGALLPIDVSIL